MSSTRTLPINGLVVSILGTSGLIAVIIACMILFAPDLFYRGYGIEIAQNATLANELKAPAGILLIAGLLMFLGAFKPKFADFSLLTATAVYLSYGLSRFSSLVIDGVPHSGMLSAMGIEVVIGVMSLFVWLKQRRGETSDAQRSSYDP